MTILLLLEKLIDRIIQLKKYHEDANRNFMKDFIDPMMDQFEEVHKGYLKSFKEYEKLIEETESHRNTVELLTERVRSDNLFSENERQRLKDLSVWIKVKTEPIETVGSYSGEEYEAYRKREEEFWRENPEIRLVWFILHYIEENNHGFTEDQYFQRWRNNFLSELQRGSPTKKDKIIVLNMTLVHLQDSYRRIMKNYSLTREKYLQIR